MIQEKETWHNWVDSIKNSLTNIKSTIDSSDIILLKNTLSSINLPKFINREIQLKIEEQDDNNTSFESETSKRKRYIELDIAMKNDINLKMYKQIILKELLNKLEEDVKRFEIIKKIQADEKFRTDYAYEEHLKQLKINSEKYIQSMQELMAILDELDKTYHDFKLALEDFNDFISLSMPLLKDRLESFASESTDNPVRKEFNLLLNQNKSTLEKHIESMFDCILDKDILTYDHYEQKIKFNLTDMLDSLNTSNLSRDDINLGADELVDYIIDPIKFELKNNFNLILESRSKILKLNEDCNIIHAKNSNITKNLSFNFNKEINQLPYSKANGLNTQQIYTFFSNNPPTTSIKTKNVEIEKNKSNTNHNRPENPTQKEKNAVIINKEMDSSRKLKLQQIQEKIDAKTTPNNFNPTKFSK